jgi:hypothetical protein
MNIGAEEEVSHHNEGKTLPAAVYCDLRESSELLKCEGRHAIDLNSLVAPRLARFTATDRSLRRTRRQTRNEDA